MFLDFAFTLFGFSIEEFVQKNRDYHLHARTHARTHARARARARAHTHTHTPHTYTWNMEGGRERAGGWEGQWEGGRAAEGARARGKEQTGEGARERNEGARERARECAGKVIGRYHLRLLVLKNN